MKRFPLAELIPLVPRIARFQNLWMHIIGNDAHARVTGAVFRSRGTEMLKRATRRCAIRFEIDPVVLLNPPAMRRWCSVTNKSKDTTSSSVVVSRTQASMTSDPDPTTQNFWREEMVVAISRIPSSMAGHNTNQTLEQRAL